MNAQPILAEPLASTATIMPTLASEAGTLRFSSFRLAERVAMGFSSFMLFITFIVAANAMGKVGDLNAIVLDGSKPAGGAPSTPTGAATAACTEENLRGARVLTSPAGRHYQIVGKQLNKDSGYSWFEAQADAEKRCYLGCRGTLAVIPNVQENMFLHTALCARMNCYNYGLQGVNQAWIGGTDLRREGYWEWGPAEGSGLRRQPFFSNGVPVGGAFQHWRPGEPNNNPLSDLGEEDCLEMDGDMTQAWNATWNDDHCYTRKSWWIVDLSFLCEA